MISGVEDKHMRASGCGLQGTRAVMLMLAVIVVAAGAFWPRQAHADFRVCNATQNLVGVAIGYRARTGWISEGWWHIEGSACKTLIEGSLQSRYYYIFAEDAERGGRWEGPINMCVADKEFKIAGVNDCYARGFERAGFQEYDTGEQENWMVQLTDSQPADAAAGVTEAPAGSESEQPAEIAPDTPRPDLPATDDDGREPTPSDAGGDTPGSDTQTDTQ